MSNDSNGYKEVQQPKKETHSQYTSISTFKRDSSALEKKPLHKYLKLLVPVIAVAVVVSIIGYIVFGVGTSKIDDVPPPTTPGAANNPPIAHNLTSISTSMNQPVNIQLSASDKDNDDLTAAIVSKPLHGQLEEINQATGIVTYTPSPGFTGSDEFTFKVNDRKTDSDNVGRVLVTINE